MNRTKLIIIFGALLLAVLAGVVKLQFNDATAADPTLRDFPDAYESKITDSRTGWGGKNLRSLGGMLGALYDEVQDAHRRVSALGGLYVADTAALQAILKADLTTALADSDVDRVMAYKGDTEQFYRWDAASTMTGDNYIASGEGGTGRWVAMTLSEESAVSVVTNNLDLKTVLAASADRNTSSTGEQDFSNTESLPGDTLSLNDVVDVTAVVSLVGCNATDTLAAKLYLGSVVIADIDAYDCTTGDEVVLKARVHVTTAGALGKINGTGVGYSGDGATNPLHSVILDEAADTTGTLVVKVSSEWSVSNAGNIADLRFLSVYANSL